MFGHEFATRVERVVAGRVLAAALIFATAWGVSLDASAQDTTPDAYDFVNQTVSGEQAVFSNTITIAGIDAPATLSLTGHSTARFRINGGSLLTGTATINNGDRIGLRLLSSATPGSRSATVNIGG